MTYAGLERRRYPRVTYTHPSCPMCGRDIESLQVFCSVGCRADANRSPEPEAAGVAPVDERPWAERSDEAWAQLDGMIADAKSQARHEGHAAQQWLAERKAERGADPLPFDDPFAEEMP